MGWAYCGKDWRGREIGYGIEATCDKRGCGADIDRGLACVCGGMHNGDEGGCGRYYCDQHLGWAGPRGGCTHRGRLAWGRTKCQLLRREGKWTGDPVIYYCACREWEYEGPALPEWNSRKGADPLLENHTLVPGFIDHARARGFPTMMRYDVAV